MLASMILLSIKIDFFKCFVFLFYFRYYMLICSFTVFQSTTVLLIVSELLGTPLFVLLFPVVGVVSSL